ncbi:MAG TPA: hypothetical protein VFZ65_13215 [Planctomycetota bacterium]|nr:hypothetical protein [Planctomycetota bacterium]
MSLAAVTSLRRNLTEWAERDANQKFLRRDQEAQLRASLEGSRPPTQVHVAAWMLGTWHLGHGFCQVLAGNGRGFDEARQGQALRRCSLLLRERHRQHVRHTRARALPFSLMHGSLTALLGLALQDPGAEDLYELLRALPDSNFGERDQLPLFVRELLTVRAGQRPTVTQRLGPYEAVFLHWTGDAHQLAQRLADLLDLHLQQARGAGSTFDDPPCQLYPVEVLAVRQVREWLGLSTPKVDHALMFTNLVTMVPDAPWPAHELVQRLERRLRGR